MKFPRHQTKRVTYPVVPVVTLGAINGKSTRRPDISSNEYSFFGFIYYLL